MHFEENISHSRVEGSPREMWERGNHSHTFK